MAIRLGVVAALAIAAPIGFSARAGATEPSLSETAFPLLVERVAGPRAGFFVFQDSDSGLNHGFPSGFFAKDGATLEKIRVEPGCIEDPAATGGCSEDPDALDRERGTVFRITFDPLSGGEFVGLHFEEPEGWSLHRTGNGYDLRGATEIVFEARSPDGAHVQFGLGGSTTPFMTVPFDWSEIRIPLSSLTPPPGLSEVHLLFTVVTNDFHASTGATVLVDRVRLEPPPMRQSAVLGFPLSTETFGVPPRRSAAPGRVPIPPDQLLRNVTTTYESALVAQTLLARGTAHDLEAAREVADAFGYALVHDNGGDPLPMATDGSTGLHNGYESGELALLNGQGPGAGQAGEIRLAGFSAGTELCGPSGFCLVLDGATGGNNAFAMFALLAVYRQTAQVAYLQDARTLGRWIIDRLSDESGTGFGGFFLGYPDEGTVPKEVIAGKSVENNADLFAAFAALAEAEKELGDAAAAGVWRARAEAAGDFVLAMFDPVSGCFHAGTVPAGSAPGPGIDPSGEQRGDDVVNRFPFLDAQTFTTLALAWDPRYRNALDWRRPVQCMLDSGYDRVVTAAGTPFRGFNLVQAPTEGPDGIAWEFTAQAVSAMRFVDALYGERRFGAVADRYLGELRQARTAAPFGDGRGVVGSTLEGGDALPPIDHCLSTPFQCIPERVGLAATTWAVLAERDVNPFRQALPGCLSPETVELTDQRVETVKVFEACDTLSAGEGFEVVAPGDATLRAGRRVVLTDGFSVTQGARFRALIDPSLR